MGVRIVNKINEFVVKNAFAADRALGHMAIDIERIAKLKAPFLTGALRSSGRGTKVAPLKHKVEFNIEYASYQEFGGDGKRVVRRYSKPGTGKLYLTNAGKEITRKAVDYFKREVANIRV